MKNFIDDGLGTWRLKDLANAIADQDSDDAASACRDLNLVYALARACYAKNNVVRKSKVYHILSNALVNAACIDDTRTIHNVWSIWDTFRQHNWPRLYANIDDLLELCVHESTFDVEGIELIESNASMLNRFIRNWLDWEYSQLFEENQAMAEARELLCEQVETGNVDKVLAACMQLSIVTANASDFAAALGYDTLDCMFRVHDLAETLTKHYPVIMGKEKQ